MHRYSIRYHVGRETMISFFSAFTIEEARKQLFSIYAPAKVIIFDELQLS